MTAVGSAWPNRERVTTPVARRSAILAGVATLVAIIASGCALPSDVGTRSSVEPVDRIHQQANAALERWAAAVRESGGAAIRFVGDRTSRIGEWEDSVRESNEAALLAGRVEADTELDSNRPSRQKVRWLDGATQDANVLSARAALDDLIATAKNECADCEPLRITGATLATGLVETSTGPAEMPTWVFTVAGTAARVTQVAVDDSVTVDPPAWNAENPPEGISIESALGTPDFSSLDVLFVGATKDAGEPCGADYTTEAVESNLAVVVIVEERRDPLTEGCPTAARVRTATVPLVAPLGTRAVLEVRQGLPVSVQAP